MRKRIKVFFMMFLIIFSFFIAGCKNEVVNVTIPSQWFDNGCDSVTFF